MGARQPLTQAEKERIYQGKLAGKKLHEVAKEVGCTLMCARKWWRVGRKHGQTGLQARRRHRGKCGHLSQFSLAVIEQASQAKKGHPGWGADRVKIELSKNTALQGLPLPGRSSLTAFFKACCPDCVRVHHARPAPPAAPPPASGVHEIWQMDAQEKIHLGNGEVVNDCDIREPFSGAMIMSWAFRVGNGDKAGKLTWTDYRATLRAGFTEWGTCPDIVQTDNEMTSVTHHPDPLPGPLTLWLVGLGIAHHLIRPHRPTDQAQVERTHRTLNGWTFDLEDLQDLEHFQQALHRERYCYNHDFPARAGDCQRQPPLAAHPDLLVPRRPYYPALELALFDMQRVYDYLATFWVRRKLTPWGQFHLMSQVYNLHLSPKDPQPIRSVLAHFDPQDLHWHIFTDTPHREEIAQFRIRGLDVTALTGLEPVPVVLPQPIQLPLPFWLCKAEGTISPGL